MQITINIPVAGGWTMSRIVCTKIVTGSTSATEGAPISQEVSHNPRVGLRSSFYIGSVNRLCLFFPADPGAFLIAQI